ncbi:thioredoxin-disulfide reductase [Candidatus Saccharibacteria bacterium]|nr:thioredoxin-disulfide reductase [Candidatus Saccharibacteria bacterium]NIV04266.1 thioredoxin-disulfide reductase [Calditrichia bacterium]NIS39107.1 thioredoxin-disulfide reductase [Candidatus Saccharibacteria bacterium]NIV72743.1 thioredoxin-disulfide reductase [Calditrichia bacterium]NIV99918.1 thioredoxin-disulfide reductase [Candidatus Saccharibacteria bacterium]
MTDKVQNIMILGSGPAGLTAGIYAARAGLAPIVVEGMKPGGQPTGTTEIENFPGFPKGIMGPELVERMRKQAERFGAKFLTGNATKVKFGKKQHTVWINTRKYSTKTLVVATGADPRWLEVEGEDKFRGRGVSSCATCDGFFYKDKVVAVVGGGDSALEEALFLTHFAKKVIVIHRRDKLRASKFMQDKANEEKKIEFYWNKTVEKIQGTKTVNGASLRDTKTGEVSNLVCDGVFVAIGHVPHTKVFEGELDIDQKGYIKVSNSVATGVCGVFAAGDVADPYYKQAITAAASGCMAAMAAEEYLASL